MLPPGRRLPPSERLSAMLYHRRTFLQAVAGAAAQSAVALQPSEARQQAELCVRQPEFPPDRCLIPLFGSKAAQRVGGNDDEWQCGRDAARFRGI